MNDIRAVAERVLGRIASFAKHDPQPDEIMFDVHDVGRLCYAALAGARERRKLPGDSVIRYPEDVSRMVRTMDGVLTREQANWLWGEYSGWMMASWLVLPDNEAELMGIIEGICCGFHATTTEGTP